MKNRKTIILFLLVTLPIIGLFVFIKIPKAHYECAGTDAAEVYFDLFYSGKFSINYRYFDIDTGEASQNTTVTGTYKEWENVYDLRFDNLSRQQIKAFMKGTTAGEFIKNSDIYRISKKQPDSLNYVNIICMIERRSILKGI